MAMTALALYILEAAMLFVSRMFGFAFILLSKEYVDSGDSSLIQLGNVLLQTKVFASAMAIIPFGIGAVIFYFLIYKSKTFPSWIPLWGTVTVIPILIGVPLNEFLISVPFALYLPYVPFEFFMGIFLLFYRFKNSEVKLILQD